MATATRIANRYAQSSSNPRSANFGADKNPGEGTDAAKVSIQKTHFAVGLGLALEALNRFAIVSTLLMATSLCAAAPQDISEDVPATAEDDYLEALDLRRDQDTPDKAETKVKGLF